MAPVTQEMQRVSKMEVTSSYGNHLIARGLKVYVGIDAHPEWVPDLLAGRATAQQILALLYEGRAGVWWGIMGEFGDLADFEDYAWADELLADTYEDLEGGDVSIVLVAKRPTRDGVPWEPEIHNEPEAGGLMGNSYLRDREQVDLVEIRYNAGKGWKSLPISGLRVTAGDLSSNDPERYEGYLTHAAAFWRSRTAALGSRLYWRVHPEGRGDILPEMATSIPFFPDPGERPQPGYSAFDDPWHLWLYIWLMWNWDGMRDSHTPVIGFSGTRVGTGNDGEDLVMPVEHGTVQTYTVREFFAELMRTPFPASPVFAPWVRGSAGGHWQTWEKAAQRLAWLDQGDPVHEHIVRTFGGAQQKAAGLNGDLPSGLVFKDGKLGPDGPDYNPSRFITVKHNGRLIAEMSWDPPYGMTVDGGQHPARINKVEVSPSYRRRGIAAEMLRRAIEITPGLRHSEQLTGDGRAWRNAVSPDQAGDPAYPMMRMLPRIAILKDVTFEVEGSKYAGKVTAHLDGRTVGTLRWATGDGGREVDNVFVAPEHRRQGIAGALWAKAKEIVPDLQHSTRQTPEGREWAQHTASTTKGHSSFRGVELGYEYVIGNVSSDRDVIERVKFDRAGGWLGTYWTGDRQLALGFATGTSRDNYRWFGGTYPDRDYYGVLIEAVHDYEPKEIKGDFVTPGESIVRNPFAGTTDRLLFHLYRLKAGTKNPEPTSAKLVRTIEVPTSMWKRGAKTAMPSWRDRGVLPAAECVIAPDLGRSHRNSYMVYLYDQPHARRPTLAEAKAIVEEIYGPLTWEKVDGDRDPHWDQVHGLTDIFNDASHLFVVRRLPRLGATSGGRANVQSSAVSGLWVWGRTSTGDYQIGSEHGPEGLSPGGAQRARTTDASPVLRRRGSLSKSEIYRFETNMRNTGNVKVLSLSECGALARKILTDARFPQGESVEVEVNYSGKSQIGWYTDTTPFTPLVSLDPRMHDDLTVIHECAHLIRNGPEMAGVVDAARFGGETHDQRWLDTFSGLVRRYADPKTARVFALIFGGHAKTASLAY